MDDRHFDDLTRTLAHGLSRRTALKVAAAGMLTALGMRSGTDAQVAQAQCGNVICANNPGKCKPGCVCCVYGNGNSRCRPPGTCGPGIEVDQTTPPPTTTPPPPPTTTITPTTTSTAAPTTTTTQPATTPVPTTTQPSTTPTPTTTAVPVPTTSPPPTTTGAPATTTTTTTAVGACGSGAPCPDDGLVCTNSRCDPERGCVHDLRSGFCLVAGICYTDGQAHDNGCAVCDVSVSTSSLTPRANGIACNDGNPCTQSDTCQDGSCIGGNPIICFVIDPCNTWACSPANGNCAPTPKPLGTSCSNLSPCDGGEICDGQGSCVAGAPIDCGPCNACDRVTGTCKPANDGAACPGDGNRCFEAFACDGGACVGTQPVECTASNPCDEPGTCDPATGQCSNPTPKANGDPCIFNNCIQDSTCQNGSCIGGTVITCPQHFEICHDYVCDPGTGSCVDTALTGGAFDRKGCDVCVACLDGVCAPGVDLLDCGRCATCDRSIHACVAKPVGSDCGSTCTERVTCTADGTCVGIPSDGCINLEFCEATVCNPDNGQCVETGAKDGQACGGDLCHVCSRGQCVPKTCGSCQRCQPGVGCVACDSCCNGVCGRTTCGDSCCAPGWECCSGSLGTECRSDPRLVCEGECLNGPRVCCGRDIFGTVQTCPIGSTCCATALDGGCCPAGSICGVFGCVSQ